EQPLPELALGDISVPSAERELVYVFTGEGRHLRTLHALTGATLYEFDYDDTNRLQSIRDFDGNVTEIQRASNGQATAIVGPFGQRTELGYDANGYLNLIRDPLGREVALGFDGQGLLTSLRNQRGDDYSFQYDASGRLALDADPAGGFQTLTRLEDPSGASVTHTTALGRSTVYDLRTLATGGTRRTTTFPNGLQNTVTTLPDGSTSTSLPEGTSVQAFLTSDPRFGIAAPLRSTTTRTPAGLTRTSARSRSVVLSDPKNPFSVVSVVDTLTENSRVSSVRYDAATRTFTSTTAAGRTSTRMIDDKGRTITAQQSGLLPATFHYDAAGRLDSMTQGSRSTTLAFVQAGPSAGYLESITTGPSDRVTYTRDPLGRVLEETLGTVTTTLTRDALGNVTSVTPPGKPAHGMTYSSVDLLETYDPPQLALPSASTAYVYDVDRFLLGETRPGGDQILRTPDGAGRIDTIAIASGLVDHDYYPSGTASGAGQKSDVRGPYGVDLHFTYDGTLETSTTWSGDVVGSVAFSYNADFEHSLEVVNGGTGSAQVTFGYDADRLVSCASPSTCSPAGADALRIARHPQHGLVSGLTLGSTSETRGYNGFGELARQTATHGSATLVDITYDSAGVARDELGRVTQKTELIAGVTKVHGYTYDSQRRLTDVTVNGSLAEHFEYDANGNRTLAFLAASGTTWTGGYDAQDRLASYGPFDFSYTANGELETKTNRETGEAWAFQYDALGNLLAVGLPDGTLIEYLVDGLGRRVGKKVGGTLVKQWLYRDGLRPAAELDANGALVSQFVYASTESVPDYVRRGGSTYRVISDELGSPVFVVNVANASDVPFRASYSSFGTVIGSGLDWMPFGFAGGIGDIHTGLVRFGARDYDPTLGRWTAKDPLRFDGKQVNLYAYVANDPVNGRDPSGRNPEACARQCSNDSVQWEEECRSKCYFDDILCNPDYDAYEDCVSACHTDTNQRTLKCWRECGAYFDSTCFGHSPEDMWCYT
ncbi:MAG TPA: RHS repeat-associated core domain-containing protein, partial [Polyangiaceae bacterium]